VKKIAVLTGGFLLLIMTMMMTNAAQAQSGKWATAYYAGWQQGYNNTGRLPAESIDFTAVTHICHFALVPNADGTLNETSNSVTAYNANAIVTAAHAAGKKVLITVGGWNSESGFAGATGSANVSNFIANLVNLMKSRGYDGIDIDWEPISSTYSSQFVSFINQLRAELDKISPRPLLTAASGWAPSMFAQTASKFDQINLMTYDMSGAWPGWVTWHNAPINDGGFRFPSTGNLVPSADGKVNEFIAAGVPASKLGIGIDFYGYVWSGGAGTTTGGATEPRQAWTTAPTVASNVPYYTIMDNYYQSQYYRFDDAAGVSYLSIDNSGSTNDKFISYDDEATIQKKFDYVRSKGIGGAIIWELGGAYRTNQPSGQRDNLLQAVKVALNGGGSSDVTPPTVSITSPLGGISITGIVVVAATASDNVGVAGVQFKVDGANLGAEVTVAPFSVSLNTAILSAGTHTISAVARDAAGNTSTASVTVTVLLGAPDTTPPTVSITSPANNSTVSNTITVSANASDNVGVAGVQFTVDGANVGSEVTSSPYSVSLNTTQYSNASHVLAAVARDAAGNKTTASVNVTVSNTVTPPPNISDMIIFQESLVSPWVNNSWSATVTYGSTEQAYAGSSSIKTALTAAWGAFSVHYGSWGSAGVTSSSYKSVDFMIYTPNTGTNIRVMFENDNGQSFPSVNVGTLTANQWKAVSIPISQLNPNNYAVNRFDIQDISGSVKTFYVDNLQFTGNVPAPLAPALASPANGATSVAINPTLSWNASANAASYRVQVSTSSSFASTVFDKSDVTTTSTAVTGLANSTTYYWRVNAANTGGTSAWSSVSSFTTIPAPDTIKPTVSFGYPVNGATISGTVSISISASDNVAVVGVQLKLDGVNLGAELTAAPYSFNWNTTQVPNGAHTLSVVARDSAGNSNTASLSVNVSNTASSPPTLVVFDDSLRYPWINTSWNATVTLGSTEQKYSGSKSIKVAQGAWGALRLHNGSWSKPVDILPATYPTVSFAIYGGASGISMSVNLASDSKGTFPAIKDISVPANQWKTFSYSMSQLNPNNLVVNSIVLQDISGTAKTFYVDDLQFNGLPQSMAKTTSVKGFEAAPSEFALAQNFPNPFNPSTEIRYALPFSADVKVEVFNTAGQQVSVLVNREQSAGMHSVTFSASSLASGVYFYRLTAKSLEDQQAKPFVMTKRMILMK